MTLPGYAFLPEARTAKKTYAAARATFDKARTRQRQVIRKQRQKQVRPVTAEMERALTTLRQVVEARLRFAKETARLLDVPSPPDATPCGALLHQLSIVQAYIHDLKELDR